MDENRIERLAMKVASGASKTAGLRIGDEEEQGGIRVKVYRDSVRVYDLENAGKRGKKVDRLSIFDMDSNGEEEYTLHADLLSKLSKAKTYAQAEKIVKGIATSAANKGMYGFRVDEQQERGVDVAPGGFAPIKIRGKHVNITSDFSSFAVRDLDDMNNEPTCIPAMRGAKTSVKMFYRWATDNKSFLKTATFNQAMEGMRKAGIPYHYYCAMD